MSDLISRQAAIEAEDEEPEVWTGNDEYAQGINNQWHYDVNALKAVPSSQPEIIRCRECKHWREGIVYSYCDKLFNMGVLDVYDYMVSDDDFCSKAERREDE